MDRLRLSYRAPTYAAALAELKKEGRCPADTLHRQVKYLNTVIEADHGKLKQLIRYVRHTLQPSSTINIAPCTQSESPLARKTAAPVMSSGCI